MKLIKMLALSMSYTAHRQDHDKNHFMSFELYRLRNEQYWYINASGKRCVLFYYRKVKI